LVEVELVAFFNVKVSFRYLHLMRAAI